VSIWFNPKLKLFDPKLKLFNPHQALKMLFMKKSNEILGVLALVLMVNFAFAQRQSPGFLTNTTDAQSIQVNLLQWSSPTAQVTIKDEHNQPLFSEFVRQTNRFERNYHLEYLAIGSYYLVVEDDTMISVQPFTIKNQEIALEVASRKDSRKAGDSANIQL